MNCDETCHAMPDLYSFKRQGELNVVAICALHSLLMVELNALLKTKGPNAGTHMHRCPTLEYRADSTWDDEKKDPGFLGEHNSILELISPDVHPKALDRSDR